LNIDFRGLYLLAAPSTPAEVVEEVAALGRKVTLEDVTRAAGARNYAPAPSKPKSTKPPPALDPIEGVANKILDRFSDGKWRSKPVIATTLQVANSAVQEALDTLEGCYVTHTRGDVLEFQFKRGGMADLRSALGAKDEEIAAKDREITSLKQRIAEQDIEIARLKEQLAAPPQLAQAAE
jgi:hypothetical protein